MPESWLTGEITHLFQTFVPGREAAKLNERKWGNLLFPGTYTGVHVSCAVTNVISDSTNTNNHIITRHLKMWKRGAEIVALIFLYFAYHVTSNFSKLMRILESVQIKSTIIFCCIHSIRLIKISINNLITGLFLQALVFLYFAILLTKLNTNSTHTHKAYMHISYKVESSNWAQGKITAFV